MLKEKNVLNDRMSSTDSSKSFEVIRFNGSKPEKGNHELICEEPLLIRVEDEPYSVVMRTPGDETFHAAGFCLAEGIVDNFSDFNTVGFCADMDSNVVEVTLRPERLEKVSSLLQRKGFISQTSCGICGKEVLDEISQILKPLSVDKKITLEEIGAAFSRLTETQRLYKKTRGSHAIVILDNGLEFLAKGEDVGRHNAFDKAVGKILMARKLQDAYIAVLSSRISFEMIQKANRAGIPFMLSASRPTALAVELARSMNMTLVCISDDTEMIIFSGQERVIC